MSARREGKCRSWHEGERGARRQRKDFDLQRRMSSATPQEGSKRVGGATEHCFMQHFENDGRRPAKQQDTIHRRNWTKQLPVFHRCYVAVAKCCEIHKCEVHDAVAKG